MAGMGYLNVFMPLFALAVLVLAHVFIFRLMPRKGLLSSLLMGFVFGFLFQVCFSFYLYSETNVILRYFIWDFLAGIVTYIVLAYCYFHFVNLGETARRIRILRELAESPGGLTQEDILARYNAAEIVDRRLRRLVENSQVVVKNDRYFIGSPAVLCMANTLIFLKMILLGKSEFEI